MGKLSIRSPYSIVDLQKVAISKGPNPKGGESWKFRQFMKATGIVRRIDDLGRVVIPKEIRRTMRIREGEPLEIFVDREGEVILKKYSPIGELNQFAQEYADALAEETDHAVFVLDRDVVVAVSGVPRKSFLDKQRSEERRVGKEW